MRRLFAEEGDVRDPLAAELESLVELAERRGAEVRVSTRGQRPVPPKPVCRALVEEVGGALLAARRSARVTLSAVGPSVVVSVVADAEAVPPAAGGHGDGAGLPGITTVTVADDQRTWVEARWTPSAS